MRYIDTKCPKCGHITVDHFQRSSMETLPACGVFVPVATEAMTGGDVHCAPCGGAVERVYLPTSRDNVIGDDIPGGVLIKNALCNADGSPRRYYSKTDIKREAEKRGYVNYVVHQPAQGSDKSKHTSRWV